ncbi:hypothetical protein CHISP_1734 [Chitinispirillum alkaliphilum]|nr:hypothetical protein CHISP_1734 [Chitinispirillum alkaliphilum]
MLPETKGIIYYGQEYEGSEPICLKAGPVTLLYQNGYIRSLFWKNKELIRRIYVALRDQYWNTIEYKVSNQKVCREEDSFHITFDCRHKRGEIDFLWQGEIIGSNYGQIIFRMNGKALTEFKTLRTGFCILHPLEFKGKEVNVEHSDKNSERIAFPQAIAPFQPLRDVRKITFSLGEECGAVLSMTGGVFETEDQRNWTDASFKTYSPPIGYPGLYTLKKYAQVNQEISLSLFGELPPGDDETAEGNTGISQSKFGLPQIGISLNPMVELSEREIYNLSLTGINHLRIGLDASEDNLDLLQRAALYCSRIQSASELALTFSHDFENEIETLLSVLRAVKIPVKRFLVYHKEFAVTPNPLIDSVKESLKAYAPGAAVCAGADHYYVELNRAKERFESADCIVFAPNPQVHTFDNDAIMENLQGLHEVVVDSERLAGDSGLVISPLTLRPRTKRSKPKKDGGADLRIKGLFGAAWTLSSFISCLSGNVESVTYFGDSMADKDTLLGDEFFSPALLVLGLIEDFRNGTITSVRTSNTNLKACLVEKGERKRVLICNTSGELQKTEMQLTCDKVQLKRLDETTYMASVQDPVGFFCAEPKSQPVEEGVVKVELLPYAVICIEF